MRGVLGLAASVLAGLAAVVASLDGDDDLVPFFILLTFAGGVAAWVAHPPFVGARRRVAQGIAIAWSVAALWVAALLVAFQASSSPPPVPEQTYLGLTAMVYHVVGMYLGGVLVLLLAFGRDRWFERSASAD